MASGMQTVIYPVKDLESAKKVYTALLGAPPAYETPYYVGWNIGGQDIGLDPNGHRQGMTAPLPFWLVDDINKAVDQLVAAVGDQQKCRETITNSAEQETPARF
jgi:hypothetical protein